MARLISSLRSVAIVALAALLAGRSGAAAEPSPFRTPNILVICADDHAAYVTGAYGNRVVRTPSIDRLAAGGIRFEHAYCNSPVCTASRQSFLTGRYPRSIGVTKLETALPKSEVTMAETLKLAGFATAAIGKMHFNSELKHGFDVRIDAPDYDAWLKQQPPVPAPPGVAVQGPWRPFKDPAAVWLNSGCLPVGLGDARMQGTWLARQAVEYLAGPRDKPFFLVVSFYEPHSPFRFPLEYHERHDPATFAAPALGPADARQVPAIFRSLSERERQGIAAAYYTSVEFMDKNVGLVLDALDRSEAAEDTIVVYLGDHGYMLGQHGRFEKHCSYEEAIRVPLVIRYPRRIAAGRVSHALVELVDLVPTLYNLCDYNTTAPLEGRSLMPLVLGNSTKHREHVIVEYAPNEEVMIRDRYWKLVYERGVTPRTDGYATGEPAPANQFRLFDLHADPQELHNVVGDKANAATVKRLTDALVEHLVKTARQPEQVPRADDPLAVLEYCVQPRDVPRPSKRD